MLSIDSTAHWLRPINLLAKRAGERSAGNLHAPFDVAGDGNQLTVRFVRHSQRKRGATDRSSLRSQAPFLDPTRPRKPVDVARINTLRVSGHSWRKIAGIMSLSVGKVYAAARTR
jgi:hypothetical protein